MKWFILTMLLSFIWHQYCHEDFIILDDPMYFIEDETWAEYEAEPVWRTCDCGCDCECEW